MKSSYGTNRFLLALEAAALIIVLAVCVIRPITASNKNEVGNHTNSEVNGSDQNAIGGTQGTENDGSEIVKPEQPNEPEEPVKPEFSEDVLAKLEMMSLEQKIAQMFIVTPEALAGVDKVTVMGNTTKKALEKYPVGGLVYSAINFQGKSQTTKMLTALQEYCKETLGTPAFLMVEELGGEEYSPLATGNRYTVQASPFEIGATGEVQKVIDTAKAISKYLKEAGFNMNLAPNADLAVGAGAAYDNKTYSTDSAVAAMMVAEAVATYKQQGIMTVMSMFPGKSQGAFMTDSKAEWEEFAGLVYKAGIGAGTDAVMVGNVYASEFTEEENVLCSMSEDVVNYIRTQMQYQGILITDSFSESIITSNYSASEAAVEAVRAGMDMIYCPGNFVEAYEALLAAVVDGEIAIESIDESVARILTCKKTIKVQE